MKHFLKKEKELRKKGFADKQIEETVDFLRQQGIETVWDIQAAYDTSLFGLKDRCGFGSHGLCCRNCNLGPCQLDSEELPLHTRLAVPKVKRSSCGKTADNMVVGMFLQTVLRGTSSHLGHAIHMAKAFVAAAKWSENFPIKDEAKLYAVAKELGINPDGMQMLDIAKEVGQKAMEDLVGQGEWPMNFALALAPKNIDKLAKAGIVPQKGAAEAIVQGIHSTAKGMMSSTDHIIRSCLKFGVIDVLALYISTSRVQVCNRSAELTSKPEPNVLYFQSSLLLTEHITNKFKIPNRDFGIWALEFYHSTWPHYTHKLIGSGYKPEPAGSTVCRIL